MTYTTAAEYDALLDELAARSGATLIPSIATTHEGRPVRGVSIGTGTKVLVFTAGLHAREWAAIAGAYHALDSLTKEGPIPSDLRVVAFPLRAGTG